VPVPALQRTHRRPRSDLGQLYVLSLAQHADRLPLRQEPGLPGREEEP
jgi:hypothetical protein